MKIKFIILFMAILFGIIGYCLSPSIAGSSATNGYTTASTDAISHVLKKHAGIDTSTLAGKKVVIYTKPASCPTGKAFLTTVNNFQYNSSLTPYYVFKQVAMPSSYKISYAIVDDNTYKLMKQGKIPYIKDAMTKEQAAIENKKYDERRKVVSSCTMFCVINPQNGKIFSYHTISKDKIYSVYDVLMKLKDNM